MKYVSGSGGISEENPTYFQAWRVSCIVVSKGGLLVIPGICSENKWIYIRLGLIDNKLHGSP